MELIKKVCSLEYAKELKKLGVKQESLWVWDRNVGIRTDKDWTIELSKHSRGIHKYSAFTVAEFGEMLPAGSKSWKYLNKNNNIKWLCSKWLYRIKDGILEAKTEADARAKMLIYLIKNKLL